MLEWDPQASPRLAALVCHPHPVHGGTMHNKVVFRAAKAALLAGLPVLRFNFRGVGQSEGKFAEGVGEREDVLAAIDSLKERFRGTPICVMGFSFGAWAGLEAGGPRPDVHALAGLGLPTGSLDFGFLRGVRKLKILIQGTDDVFAPRAQVESLYAAMPEPKQIHWVQGADHFFTGRLDEVQSTLQEFLREVLTKDFEK